MIELYTWPTPNGRKISIALEEFELEYNPHAINIGKDEQYDPAFMKISPNNKIPVIIDEATGRSMMESGAILLYLAETYDKFMGDDRYETLEWLMFQMGGLGPMLGQAHHFLHYNPGKAPYADERYRAEARRLYSVLNKRLSDKEYLSGSYSIADMATWPWISRYEWQDIDWQDYPSLKEWYVKIAERAPVQRGYKVPIEMNAIPIPD